VHEYEFNFGSLNIVELFFSDAEARERYESSDYPGDTQAEIDAFIASGVDGVVFADYDPSGNPHRTLRLFSDAALARLTQQATA
jgi:hypothetical protein